MHVHLSHYWLTLRCAMPMELLLQQAHSHVMELCPTCRGEWDGHPRFHATTAGLDGRAGAARRAPAGRDFSLGLYAREQRHQARIRAILRRAREDLARLRRQPIETWPETLDRSKTRYRSRTFVLLLLDEAKRIVRTRPRQAAALTALAPLCLDRDENRKTMAWAQELKVLAAAHHANALRIAGDLPAADRAFRALHRQSEMLALDATAAAEVASLEASLRIGQRRFAAADRLLAAAAEALGSAPEANRIVIKHANLLEALGRSEEALDRFERAAAGLDALAEPQLHLCTVTGRINCLCDLGRFEEAEKLAASEGAAYTDSGDAYTAAYFTVHRARVDLGLGRLEPAQTGFAAARDQLLAIDRDYDAILACLFLADALLAAGKTAELRDLAAGLVPLFKARGVERETLAALRLLAEAARSETLTALVVAEVRRRLEPAGRSAALPAEP
jgi:tetratricopeptide (TPR) repeat protein